MPRSAHYPELTPPSLIQIIPKVGIHYVDVNVQQREEVVEVGTSKGDETED